MSDTVCVRTFHTRIEAELAQALLKEEGIPSIVSGDAAGWAPHLAAADGGVRLLVMEENAERAATMLDQVSKD